jgi:glycerophosphoryl diester phosphodiesterase
MADRLITIAHRAGNDPTSVRDALAAGVDLVEADIHRFRGELEIRHWKAAGRTFLWERDRLARRRDVPVPTLSELLAAVGGDPRLLLDLKGVAPRLGPALVRQLRAEAPGVPVTICTRQWWMIRAFAAESNVAVVLSAGNRRELRRLPAAIRRWRPVAVCVRRALLEPGTVAALRASAGAVWTWLVNDDAALADARRLGVTGVISDDLAVLRRVNGSSG